MSLFVGSRFKFNDLVYSAPDDFEKSAFRTSWERKHIAVNHANNMISAVNELKPGKLKDLKQYSFLESALKNFSEDTPQGSTSKGDDTTDDKDADWRNVDAYISVVDTIRCAYWRECNIAVRRFEACFPSQSTGIHTWLFLAFPPAACACKDPAPKHNRSYVHASPDAVGVRQKHALRTAPSFSGVHFGAKTGPKSVFGL